MMKTTLSLIKLCFITVILFTAVPVLSQTDSTKQKPKKKSILGEIIKDVGKEVLNTAGIPTEGSNSGTSGSAGSKTSSSGVSSIKGNIIKGHWKEYGGGGGNFSPRDHYYTFEVTQDNAEATFQLNAGNLASGLITSGNGQRVETIYGNGSSNKRRFQRAGTYNLYIATHDRYTVGEYELIANGPVRNFQQQKHAFWTQDKVSFGEEGGSTNDRSARNHQYIFEPEPDQSFDVNVESDGIKIHVVVIDPTGKRLGGKHYGNSGIDYVLSNAQQKGKYQIWVSPGEPNGKGGYKLEVAGNLKQNPVQVPSSHQVVKAKFSPSSKRHEYIIPAKAGNMEVIYRSTSTAAQFKVYDAYNQVIGYSQYGEKQLSEEYIPVKQAGNLKVVVETQQPEVGEYELLVWGYFDKITGKNIQTPNTQPQKQQIPGYDSGRQATQVANTDMGSGAANVLINGRVRSKDPNVVYNDMTVVFEDLETGERIGEVSPDNSGVYSFPLPPGRHYSITVLSGDGYIASSQNVNLTKKVSGKTTVNDITLISGEVGDVINLNNIFFQTGKATLLPQSYAELNRIANFLKANPGIKIEISGHTDSQGSPEANKVLSNDRALAVAYNLQGQQISASRVKAVGYGPAKPVSSNTTEEGRAQNRRVEFRITSR
jgi:outer membrane protein OmpA-like peptidoglycan-associated protein